jgi:hypothetical protein
MYHCEEDLWFFLKKKMNTRNFTSWHRNKKQQRMLGPKPPTKTPLRLVAYGSATTCSADMTEFVMVPFGSIPGVNYGYLHQYFAQHGLSAPDTVPSPYQTGYKWGYYETEFATSPTTGILSWLCNEDLRKKNEAQKHAVQKLTKQQQDLCQQIEKFQKQFQKLETDLQSAKNAACKDAKLIQTLTTKIELLLELLTDVGGVSHS